MNDKIFIVEDEIVVANDIRQILSKNGFKVLGIATKYKKAIDEIKQLKPDLILCDIRLREEMSGIELMQELSKTMCFKIIFISAYSDIETIQKANLLNPFNYLTKPFNDQQLLTSVRLALLSINNDENDLQRPSKREAEIIKLLSQGLNNVQIGEKLFISQYTVKTHRGNLLNKYKLKNTAELINLSKNNGWI